jgi:hypothetical protein
MIALKLFVHVLLSVITIHKVWPANLTGDVLWATSRAVVDVLFRGQSKTRQVDLEVVVEARPLVSVGSVDHDVLAVTSARFAGAAVLDACPAVDSVSCQLDAFEDTEAAGLGPAVDSTPE